MAEENKNPKETDTEAEDPRVEEGKASKMELDAFDDKSSRDEKPGELERVGDDLAAVYKVPVDVKVVLGNFRMQVEQLLKLSRGAVIELDRKAGEPVDIVMNDRLIARAELVIVEDERIGVTLTEIIKDGIVG